MPLAWIERDNDPVIPFHPKHYTEHTRLVKGFLGYRRIAICFYPVGRSQNVNDLRLGHFKFVACEYLKLLPRVPGEANSH